MTGNNILNLFHGFFRNLLQIFSWKNLRWHVLAIILTYLIFMSGIDRGYYNFFRHSFLYPVSFSAAILGSLVPLLFPLMLFLVASLKNNSKLFNTAFATGQAAMLGSLISSFYKSLTGRGYPPHLDFHFSWFQGGFFWGWPSSHTMIAFAMTVTLIYLYPENKRLKFFAWVYAFYMGLFVAISIHWFSDFIAGAIIGSVIGVVVGKSFQSRFLILK